MNIIKVKIIKDAENNNKTIEMSRHTGNIILRWIKTVLKREPKILMKSSWSMEFENDVTECHKINFEEEMLNIMHKEIENNNRLKKQSPSHHAMALSAQVWCNPTTSNIEMDVRLATEFALIIDEITSQAWLGNATTGELLNEISARSDLSYRTVDD